MRATDPISFFFWFYFSLVSLLLATAKDGIILWCPTPVLEGCHPAQFSDFHLLITRFSNCVCRGELPNSDGHQPSSTGAPFQKLCLKTKSVVHIFTVSTFSLPRTDI